MTWPVPARPVAPPQPAPARHRQRSRLGRLTIALVVVLLVAVPAVAGGVVLGRRLDTKLPLLAQTHPLATHCALSPFGADANLVISGVGAIGFCRSQARTLSSQGEAWAYRADTKLVAPDSGKPSDLSRICALERGRLDAAIYDDLGRRIGTALCHTYAATGWELRS